MRVFIFIEALLAILVFGTISSATVDSLDVKSPEVVIPEISFPSTQAVTPIPAPKLDPLVSPKVVLCHLTTGDFVISDSDGFGLCKERGGQAIAGRDSQRDLKNIKDQSAM